MDCEELTQLLSEHHLTELTGEQRAAVGEHLAGCAACRAKQGLDEQSQALHDAATPLRGRQGAEHSLLDKVVAGVPKASPGKRRRLGGFELLGRLGKGGMGTVLKARQLSMDRLVALKILPRRLAENEAFVARFLRETRSAARLYHPYIVRAYDVGQAGGYYYFAMEYIEGEGLNAILAREGRLEPTRALRFMKQVCSALAAAHKAGIIHRDVKPSNLMLDKYGDVRVTDFGLAKITEGDATITADGQTLGSPAYVSPEMAAGKEVDVRADLYSLGAAFYHLLAGRPPFEGGNLAQLIIKHVSEMPAALAQVAPHVDPRLCRIIDRLLRKEPAARYESAQALLNALEALGELRPAARRGGVSPGMPSAEGSTPTLPPALRPGSGVAPRAPGRPKRRTVTSIVAASIALLLAAIGVAVYVRRRATARQETPPPTASEVPKPAQPDPRERSSQAAFRSIEDLGPGKWQSLFDGKTLSGWRRVETFSGANLRWGDGQGGDVRIENGRMLLDCGRPLTGIAWTGEFPTENYEVALEAMRVSGENDCPRVIFPVGAKWCKLVVAGHGNSVVGLGLVDGRRQDGNMTTRRTGIVNNRWYEVQLRVTTATIEMWLDGRKLIDLARAGHHFTVIDGYPREVFGLYTWGSVISLRNIRLRRLKPEAPLPEPAGAWTPLFDGKTLESWRVIERFPGGPTWWEGDRGGKVRVIDGRVVLEPGDPLTAMSWTGEFPRDDYEIALEAMRLEGNFACPVICFPVGAESCRFMAGGWANSVVGIGTVDGRTALRNVTTRRMGTATNIWYRVRLRVSKARVQAWLDDQQVVDLARAGRRFGTIPGWPADALTFCSFGRSSVITLRDIRLRRLPPHEIGVAQAEPRPGPWAVYEEWPFDAAEAKRRQTETARALGVKGERDFDLGAGVTLAMVLIPAGQFVMGGVGGASPEEVAKRYGGEAKHYRREFPARRVRISKPFWLGKIEVTQEQWQAVMGNNPSLLKRTPRHPVEQVSWPDCKAFLQRLTLKLGRPCRLPTEAEWEYACRAGASSAFSFGDDVARLEHYAWFSPTSRDSTQAVGQLKPNAWGLYDMYGNVAEWCEDAYAAYKRGHQTDPRGPGGGARHWPRVVRGGCFRSEAGRLRSACRYANGAGSRLVDYGLRVAMPVTGERGDRTPAREAPKLPEAVGQWVEIFDGKSLRGWRVEHRWGFGKHGEVTVDDTQISLQRGDPLTGVAWTSGFPAMGYEVELEARRVAGDGDFANVTFPVGSTYCTFHTGCWADRSVGLSKVDGRPYDERATRRKMDFENGRWYRLRVRVTRERIQCWIDDVAMVDLASAGHRLSPENGALKPFGVCSWAASSALRNIRLRRLDADGAKGFRTATVGGESGNDFEDRLEGTGYLVGFRYSRTRYADYLLIESVEPLYRTPAGLKRGGVYGRYRRRPAEATEVVAKSGYAVGALVVPMGIYLDRFKIIFMRVAGDALDPRDTYESDWLGGPGGDREITVGGSGNRIVGIHGRATQIVDALGLIELGPTPGFRTPWEPIAPSRSAPEAGRRVP